MASKSSKWLAMVASGAISVMMGGAAFGAPVSAFEEGPRQVRQVRSNDDASDLISKVLGKIASNVGTKVAEVKGQAREVVSQAP